MDATPVTLLDRLRQPNPSTAWVRFFDLYSPLLYKYARRRGVPDSEASDIVQEVFVVLVRKLPEFAYDPNRSFRRWLHTLLMNKWRDRQRQQATAPRVLDDNHLADQADPDPGEMLAEAEYRNELVARAMKLMRTDFEATTWQACWQHGVIGRPAAEVGRELGISVNAVFLATSRVLRRLRQEMSGLLD